ncbi:MAG: hypothetical protein AB7J35_05720 [Dehalococcoidia bacterium]
MDRFVPPHLDIAALGKALDAERTRRRLTWVEVGKQLGIPTVRAMVTGSHIQADGAVLVLQWLGKRCDEFVVRPGGNPAPWADRAELQGPPPLFARFDTIKLHAALDRARRERGLTWGVVAAELGTMPGVIARFTKGGRTNAQLMVAAAEWAGEPVEALLQPSQPFLGPARMDARGALRRART